MGEVFFIFWLKCVQWEIHQLPASLLFKGLVVSCITSVAAYLIQLFSSFSGLQQFAVFVASGLVTACITVLVFGIFLKPVSPVPISAGQIFDSLFSPAYRKIAKRMIWLVAIGLVIMFWQMEQWRKVLTFGLGRKLPPCPLMGKVHPHSNFKMKWGHQSSLTAKFLLEASGFGRVLPRLLYLEFSSDFPMRQSFFTHIEDHIDDNHFDRDRILIVIHPQQRDVWYWLISLSDGRCSLGLVTTSTFFDNFPGKSDLEVIRDVVAASPD